MNDKARLQILKLKMLAIFLALFLPSSYRHRSWPSSRSTNSSLILCVYGLPINCCDCVRPLTFLRCFEPDETDSLIHWHFCRSFNFIHGWIYGKGLWVYCDFRTVPWLRWRRKSGLTHFSANFPDDVTNFAEFCNFQSNI